MTLAAFNHADPDAGLQASKDWRGAREPLADATASLREGLDEMFTVRRIGVSDRLARSLTPTKPTESMISISRSMSRNVRRWRDGKMIERWAAAGMLNAERSFRRVKGCKDMPTLAAALTRHVDVARSWETDEVA